MEEPSRSSGRNSSGMMPPATPLLRCTCAQPHDPRICAVKRCRNDVHDGIDQGVFDGCTAVDGAQLTLGLRAGDGAGSCAWPRVPWRLCAAAALACCGRLPAGNKSRETLVHSSARVILSVEADTSEIWLSELKRCNAHSKLPYATGEVNSTCGLRAAMRHLAAVAVDLVVAAAALAGAAPSFQHLHRSSLGPDERKVRMSMGLCRSSTRQQ